MTMETLDLLVRYDEVEQKLKFFGVPRDAALGLGSGKLPHLELDLERLRQKGPDEAERIAGSNVFVFFDYHASTKTGVRDYAAAAKEFQTKYASDTKQGAARNNPEAQYQLALHHLDNSIRCKSRVDLELAEKWLRTSAASGSKAAKDYLEQQWERVKAHAERRITDSEQ